MSPEQAKGRLVDHRTDVFSFGCVLYEMLTGRAAFDGEDVSDILSRILQKEPDWTLLPADVPARVRDTLQLCLERDLKNRRQSIVDVRIDIEHASSSPLSSPKSATAVPTKRAPGAAWIIAIFALLVAGGLSVPAIRHLRETPLPEIRVEISTPPTPDLMSMALSPDAQRIVFVANGNGQPQLWLRSLDSESVRALPGTEGATYPFWSPDGRSIGFFADAKLKRLEIAGGNAQILASAATGRGGSWNSEGVIIFTDSTTSPILRISENGGAPAPVTRLTQQRSHRFPKFLPDGRHFLFFGQGNSENTGISSVPWTIRKWRKGSSMRMRAGNTRHRDICCLYIRVPCLPRNSILHSSNSVEILFPSPTRWRSI